MPRTKRSRPKGPYLRFEGPFDIAGRKTKMWEVFSTGGTILGVVDYRAGWRRYVWSPGVKSVIFDAECLRELSQFLDEKTAEQKALARG